MDSDTRKRSRKGRKKLAAILSITVLMVLAAIVAGWKNRPVSVSENGQIETTRSPEPAGPTDSVAPSMIRFQQMTSEQTGIHFQYYGSLSDQHYMTEQNGGGLGLLDVDADEQLDLFFVNGSHFLNPAEQHNASNTCYRNRGELRFQDVTEQTGLTASNFGQGCSCGDLNNDGFVDLFVACYGVSRLWHNNGDGTFTEVTESALPGKEGFASSAAFADLDTDGDLDLYVVNYLEWTPDNKPRDRVPSPLEFSGQADCLYENLGDGRFIDVGKSAGVSLEGDGKGLALAIADLNGDRRLDIYVANDTARNFLFLNEGDMLFEEMGVPLGCAVSENGEIGSSMGVAVSDYNSDGRPDLFVTNFAHEVVDVLMNSGDSGFLATNSELGLDPISRPLLNFGIVAEDFDLDSWPDLFFANGHLWDETPSGGQFHMHPSILANSKGTRFVDAGDSAGSYFQQKWLGRATATGDLDNDGDTDLVVSHLMAPPAILKNECVHRSRGQRVRFIGRKSSRQPLGCQVEIKFSDQSKLIKHVPSGGSFQSSHDSIVIVPMSDSHRIEQISLCWPNGSVEKWAIGDLSDEITLVEGTGAPQ